MSDMEGVEADVTRMAMPPEGRQLHRGSEGVSYVRAGGGRMAYVLVWFRRRFDMLFGLCCRHMMGEKVVYSSPRAISRAKKKLFDVPLSEYEEAHVERRRSLLSCRPPPLLITIFVVGFALYVVCVIGTAATRAMWAVTSEMGEHNFSPGGLAPSAIGSTPSTVEVASAPPTLPVLRFIFLSDPAYALVMLFRSLVNMMSMKGYKHCQVRYTSYLISCVHAMLMIIITMMHAPYLALKCRSH